MFTLMKSRFQSGLKMALIMSCLSISLLSGCVARDSQIHTEICPEVDLRIDSPYSDDIDQDAEKPNPPPKKQPRILEPVKALMRIFSSKDNLAEPRVKPQSEGLEAARAAPRLVARGPTCLKPPNIKHEKA